MFTGVNLGDVRKLTESAGLVARRPDPLSSTPGRERREAARILIVEEPFRFVIELCDPSDRRSGTYRGVSFLTAIDGTGHVKDRDILEISETLPFAHLCRDQDGDIMIKSELILAGTSEAHYREFLDVWLRVWLQTAALARPARRRRGGKCGPVGPRGAPHLVPRLRHRLRRPPELG